MIKHHPKFELIQLFAQGDLPASLAAGIAIHAGMCPTCQQQIIQFTEQISMAIFEDSAEDSTEDGFEPNFALSHEEVDEATIDNMIESITASAEVDVLDNNIEKKVVFKNSTYTLPKALNNMILGKTAQIGKLIRTRIQLNENEIHTNLLHIEPGGSVPEHTHKGFELTILLSGSFHDEHGVYVKGDFIMLDNSNQHQPTSKNGCLCYTVANEALHFTQGINKLLNPIGTFIY